MNRLTKHINLVLISSSLILHGCRGWEDEKARARKKEENKAEQEQLVGPDGTVIAGPVPAEAVPGSSTSGYTSGTHGGSHIQHYPHYIPVPIGGGWRGTAPSVSPGLRSGAGGSPASGIRPGGSSSGGGARSSVGSARGGFGGSAHGVAS
jgi:hypothetical protein